MRPLCPSVNRAEYPKASYGIVEGVAGGVMGIQPSASKGRVTTMSRLSDSIDQAELKNIPVFGGYVTVAHMGRKKSRLTNQTGKPIVWRAAFKGSHSLIE